MKKLDPYLSPNPDLAALLHPAQAFAHPRDVVDDPDLTLNEKRAILASWVSDAGAVEAADEILRALRALDAAANATAWARRQVRRESIEAFRRRRGAGDGKSGPALSH